jgi:hypothetical protein
LCFFSGCARAGLVGVNVVAVDGSKVSANASREVSVDYERLAREILADQRAVHAEEDARFGIAAATSCRPRRRLPTAGSGGSRRPSAGWMISARAGRADPARPAEARAGGQPPAA